MVMAGCGALLFSLMTADGIDTKIVDAVGILGFASGTICFVGEICTVTAERKRRGTQRQQPPSPAVVVEELVGGCSWWFVAATFLVTTSYTVLLAIYAIGVQAWVLRVGNMLLPFVGVSMAIGTMLRPKDEGTGLKLLHIQFFVFAILSELASAIGKFRRPGYVLSGLSALLRVPFWCLLYAMGLKLRTKTAQLPPADLSEFLCNHLLLRGIGAMAPMIFFTFETVSCFVGEGLESDQCNNTMYAALSLSAYVAVIAVVSIGDKAVPREERRERLTFEGLAVLRLKTRMKFQGVFGIVTMLASMYFFSALGVKGAPINSIWITGAVGFIALFGAMMIELYYLVKSRKKQRGDSDAGLRRSLSGSKYSIKSERRLSLSKVSGEMTIAGMV